MKTPELQIRTPEGIVFSQNLAGPVIRFMAWLIDLACIMVILFFLGIAVSIVRALNANIGAAIYTLSYFVLSIGYAIFCEWILRGQTIGKRLFGLRVVDAEGMRLQFNQIVTRNLLRFVDSLPALYFVGGVFCAANRHCQRLGDIAANTIVIRTPRVAEPDVDQLLAGKFNSLRAYPHLAARLRQRVAPAEAALIVQALIRRGELEPGARIDLFAELASHFRAKVDFPPEATDGITDEQFLRNVADVIYRTRTEIRPMPWS
jgi:uncharacterized RDD family membrane protein YckC